MSNESAKKEFPDSKQRAAIANKKFRAKSKKESMFCKIYGFETKENDTGLIKSGYIATTHLDQGWFDEQDVFIRDQIPKETLQVWADDINSGNPRSNKVSIHHNRESHVAGVMIKGSAHVDNLGMGEDGKEHYGLYVDHLIDKTKDNFEDTKYQVDNGIIDSFSIEFTTMNPGTGKYLDNAVIEEETDWGKIRTLLPGTILEGDTLASRPMNEHAIMIKEVRELSSTSNLKKEKEDKKMTEKKEEPAPEEKPAAEETKPEEPKETEAPKDEEKSNAVDAKEKEEFNEFKEWKETKDKKDMRNTEVKEIKEAVLKDLKEVKIESKVQVNTDKNVECKELVEFKESIKIDSRLTSLDQFKMAGKIAEKSGLLDEGGITGAHNGKAVEVKSAKGLMEFQVKISDVKGQCLKQTMEYKNLGITTNQNTDTDYLLSAAELADVFDPVIFNMLNQATTTWNILPKEDFSTKGNNQVQFTGKTAANASAGAYTGNAVNSGNVGRLKFQTKFKKYQVGITVDGDMIAAARGGPIGDVFAREVSDSTDDLLSVMNVDLFAEVGLETAAEVIGFEYIADSAGNTSLYNLTRSAANKLSPDTATDTYINGQGQTVSLGNLRALKRNALQNEGAKIENLIYITSYTQGDLFRGIYDASQRLIPTSSRFGFEGRPEFDGIPIFEDKDCNSDDWFIIDLETIRIAIWVPPTLEMLGKDSDSQKGFIKVYWATYYRAPRRLGMIYNNATS